jgi:hypothetical protein
VSDADEFRKQAEDARQMAVRSLNHEDKDFLLRLAEDWIKLAQDADNDLSPPGPQGDRNSTETVQADRRRRTAKYGAWSGLEVPGLRSPLG